jgi:hypothetical protein
MTTPYGVTPGPREGTATFRLMPTDDPASGTSGATVDVAAGGRALLLSYTWEHPQDGAQSGTLLLGVPDETGRVGAGWVDSWHQPGVAALTGTVTAAGAVVGYEYAPGWRWEVELEVADGVPVLVMRNVVPDREDGPGATYEVTRSSWS